MINFLNKFSLVCLLFFVQACQMNPATGEKEISLMSEKEEEFIGKREHKKLISQFGGVYKKKDLQSYVNSIGNFLVSTSELPNKKFTFTVLDSSIVNAFALPGGYIYLTRGLIALCNNEAQLAGVIAHEIGHVTARHAAQRYTKTIGTNLVGNILNVLVKNPAIGNLVGQGAGLYLLSYSRSQEIQADKLAVRYMSRAGFHEREMASFLKSMEKYSTLSKKISNQDTNNNSDLLSTHPSSSKRISKVISESELVRTYKPIIGREIFLKKIDGLRFGESPKQGIIFGDHFLHSFLKIKFKLPEDFFFSNTSEYLLGRNEKNSQIVIDVKNIDASTDVLKYTKTILGKNFPNNFNRTFIDGMDTIDINFKNKTKMNRLVVVKQNNRVFRMLLISDENDFLNDDRSFQKIVSSIRRLKENEIQNPKKKVLRIYTVKPNDTFEKILKKQKIQKRFSKRIFMILNEKQTETIEVGEKIKIISSEY